MLTDSPELAVVIPVYNEAGAIEGVIRSWTRRLESLSIDFEIHAYNDGSSDQTAKILGDLARSNPHLCVHNKENSGHGPTILQGYCENANADWVFQVDGDDEMKPDSFPALWALREEYDMLVGERDRHGQPPARQLISAVSRATVRLFYGSKIFDVNAPYRLMRSAAFARAWAAIPSDTFAPNVVIAGLASALDMRVYRTNVSQEPRQSGEVSIKHWKLLKAAIRSFAQTISLRRLAAELRAS